MPETVAAVARISQRTGASAEVFWSKGGVPTIVWLQEYATGTR
jgi:hypothetical protein